MGKSLVFNVTFVCFLVIRFANGQCPDSCQCVHTQQWTVNCRSAQLTNLPRSDLPKDILKFDFSNNNIITLYNNSFVAELSSVEILLLAKNKIRYIEVNSLTNLNSLINLDLSGNDLSYIDPKVFSGNTNLMSLNLTDNPDLKLPSTGYNLPELVKLEMDQCRMKQIPDNFFKNMSNIRFLYLSGNELSSIGLTNFKHVTHLEVLDLSDNWFKVFQRDFIELHSSTKVKITKNPWICDCSFISALEFLERRGNVEPPVCKSPRQLRGLVANKTTINEALKCDLLSMTTLSTTEIYYDAFLDSDWYDYEDNSGEKLAHLELEVDDVTEGTRPPPPVTEVVHVASVDSWIIDNQWWIYCVAVVLVVGLAASIVNTHVNQKRETNLLTNVHFNDDV